MSKLKEHLNEMVNNPSNNPKDMAKDVEGTFEDILFQLESIADMPAVNFNVAKKLRKEIIALRKMGFEISKSIKSGV